MNGALNFALSWDRDIKLFILFILQPEFCGDVYPMVG